MLDILTRRQPGFCAGLSQLWQVPLPEGVIPSMKTFQITVTAPGWPVTDFALVGDPILELHLERFGV